jgi:acyl-CoA hydrolase
MSLSLHAGATIDAIRAAGADANRLLVVETNPAAPRTFGIGPEHPHRIHVSEADVIVESTRPLFLLPDAPPTDAEIKIAEFAAAYIHEGATLQTGIGGIPSQVVSLLAERPGGDYGVHSEMFTTGLMRLHKAGKVSNAHKGQYDGVSITTFSAGTEELYEWLDGNDAVRFLPVDIVNAPDVIARNHNMATINGALAIDLFGQAMADSVNGKQFSGIGGHEDFVAASGLEFSDRALVCLPSTTTVGGELVSRITAALPAGTPITTPRHQLDLVVTEFGVAELRARTVRERAFALAEIAHPQVRDELRTHARTL